LSDFAAGFFGIPYEGQFNLELMIESPKFNNTGGGYRDAKKGNMSMADGTITAPYDACTNANKAVGSIGSAASDKYTASAFADTVERLKPMMPGFNLTVTDVLAMLDLCAYETVALGYSSFCGVFSEDEWAKYEYSYDLSFYVRRPEQLGFKSFKVLS
jgi:hypothetical protein